MDYVLKILRSFEFKVIKIKFIIIYFLNVTDILFTLLLLKSGMFEEGNLIMKEVVTSEGVSILLKLGLPLLLLIIIFKRIKDANEMQLRIGNILINSCLVFYGCVNLSHIIWMVLYNKYIF